MNAKNNRKNHDFQLVYFMAGGCHTPDGAYALLCDQREDRQMALGAASAAKLKERAAVLRAEQKRDSENPIWALEGLAELREIEAMAEVSAKNIAAAQAELATIEKCIEYLQPLRKFAHLPDVEAHEAAQHDEWKLELIHRAENMLITTGTIATDHFATMRMHPAFLTEIYPAIKGIRNSLGMQPLPIEIETNVLKLLEKKEPHHELLSCN